MAKSKVQDSSYIDNNMLFGVYKGEYLGLSLNNKKVNRSANVLVIGGTGTGKTFKYIKPNILQENFRRYFSFVCTVSAFQRI